MIMFPRCLMLNLPKWLFMIAKVVVHGSGWKVLDIVLAKLVVHGWGWKVVDVDLAKVVVHDLAKVVVHSCQSGCS